MECLPRAGAVLRAARGGPASGRADRALLPAFLALLVATLSPCHPPCSHTKTSRPTRWVLKRRLWIQKTRGKTQHRLKNWAVGDRFVGRQVSWRRKVYLTGEGKPSEERKGNYPKETNKNTHRDGFEASGVVYEWRNLKKENKTHRGTVAKWNEKNDAREHIWIIKCVWRQ